MVATGLYLCPTNNTALAVLPQFVPPWLFCRVNDTPLDWFEVFYRIGSIIYGGGQVGAHQPGTKSAESFVSLG